MANPFYVAPPNILAALMAGTQGYKIGQEASRDSAIDDAAAALKSGDNKGVLDALLRARQIGPAIEFAKLNRQQEAGAQFASDLGGLFGGGGSAPPAATPLPPPPQRQPVPATDPRPLPSGGPTSNLTDPSVKITGIDYGPITNAKGETIAAGAGYIPEPQQPANAPLQQRPVQTETIRPPGAVPVSGSLGGVSLDRAVPALLRAATNPNLDKGQQETARMLLGKAMDQYPQEIRQLEIFRQRPDLFKMAIQLKQAGATAITNDMRGENEEAKGLGKGAAERANATIQAATAATKTLAGINRSEALLSQVQQGKIEPTRITISAWAKSLGMDDSVAERLGLDPKGVGSAQALNALTAESVISKIGSGGFPANNFSDADRQFLLGTVVQLGNDPSANKIILETGRRIAQLDIQKAREWQEFRRDPTNKGKGYDDFEIQWVDKVAKQDRFGDLRNQAETIIGRPRQGGQQMPQGARQASDGKFYVPDPNRPGKYLEVRP